MSKSSELLKTEVRTSRKIALAWSVGVTMARPPTEDTSRPSPKGPGTVEISTWGRTGRGLVNGGTGEWMKGIKKGRKN